MVVWCLYEVVATGMLSGESDVLRQVLWTVYVVLVGCFVELFGVDVAQKEVAAAVVWKVVKDSD